jgi:hypothetical protein
MLPQLVPPDFDDCVPALTDQSRAASRPSGQPQVRNDFTAHLETMQPFEASSNQDFVRSKY